MTADALNNLKDKYTKDFDRFRQLLYKGYKPDYTVLLYEIAVIENSDYFENYIY
jgi:hypothetical protein